METTNKNAGFINENHAKELAEIFGDKGKQVAKRLAADPKATALSLLFENFTKETGK